MEIEVYERRTNREMQPIYRKPGINVINLVSKRLDWVDDIWRDHMALKKKKAPVKKINENLV